MRCREGVAEVSRGVVGCRGGVVGCREGVAEVSRGVAEVSWCVDRPSTQINALTCLTIPTRLSVRAASGRSGRKREHSHTCRVGSYRALSRSSGQLCALWGT